MSPKLVDRPVVKLPHTVRTKGSVADASKDFRYWEIPGEDGVKAAQELIRSYKAAHRQRTLFDQLFRGLYDAQLPYWVVAARQGSAIVQAAALMTSYTRARANIIRRCVDTAGSMLLRSRTELRCETDGASWKLQKRAKAQTKFVNGILRNVGFYELQKETFPDACCSRAGGVVLFEIDEVNERITAKRIHPSFVVWNDYESLPLRTLGMSYPETRSVLMDLYPKQADKLRTVKGAVRELTRAYRRMFGNEYMADQVQVDESWHLSADEKKPGRHIKAVDGVVLVDEEWDLDFFPVARNMWAPSDAGWCNSPLAEQLIGYHTQVSEMMLAIVKAQRLVCMPRVILSDGAQLEEDELTNEIGGVLHVKGGGPGSVQIGPAQAMPPEYYAWVDKLISMAMADAGINDMQSQGLKPAGLDSGKAIREYNDTGSTRQILHGQMIEDMTVQAGKIVFRLAAKLAEKKSDFAVNAMGPKSYERISWKDVATDLKDIRLVTNPVSALSSTTAGRIQDVTDIIKGGLLPPEEVQGGLGLKLLNFPDLEKVITIETAVRELVDMMVDGALYDGEFFAPEPYLGPSGLTLLKTMAFRAYAQALQMDGVPERNMDLLRRHMSEADSLTQRLAGAQNIQQPQAAVPAPAPPSPEQSPIAPPPMAMAQGAL